MKTQQSLLKTLPIITMMLAALSLSPAIVYADKDRGHSYHKTNSFSHNNHGRSHGKNHKRHRSHKPKHHHNNWRGYTSKHRYNRHDHHGHRSHRPVYIVNDHYDNHYYGLDKLGFMLGIHTGNFEISFHD